MENKLISYYIFYLIAIIITFSLASTNTAQAEEGRSFIKSFLDRLKNNHEILTCQDVYKALFQYSCGMDHFVENEDNARELLKTELSLLPEGNFPDEKLIEFLSDDISVCRINLRPFLQYGGNPDRLTRAFFLSSKEFRKDNEKFKTLWKTFLEMVDKGVLNFPREEAHLLNEEAKKSDYKKNFSHSKHYKELYKPAYRVILTKYLEILF